MSAGDVIAQAARAVAAHMWDRDTAEAPTWGALTPSEQDAVIENEQTAGIARALADAGLLARPLPTREEIAHVVRQAIEDYYNSLPEAGDTYSEDDHITGAVLALLEGRRP